MNAQEIVEGIASGLSIRILTAAVPNATEAMKVEAEEIGKGLAQLGYDAYQLFVQVKALPKPAKTDSK